MLLPQETTDEEEMEDPRQELVERLLEYKMYKYASLELKDRHLDADKMFFKKSTLPPEVADFKEEIPLEDLLSDLTLSKLNEIFKSVMKKQVDKIPVPSGVLFRLPHRHQTEWHDVCYKAMHSSATQNSSH